MRLFFGKIAGSALHGRNFTIGRYRPFSQKISLRQLRFEIYFKKNFW